MRSVIILSEIIIIVTINIASLGLDATNILP